MNILFLVVFYDYCIDTICIVYSLLQLFIRVLSLSTFILNLRRKIIVCGYYIIFDEYENSERYQYHFVCMHWHNTKQPTMLIMHCKRSDNIMITLTDDGLVTFWHSCDRIITLLLQNVIMIWHKPATICRLTSSRCKCLAHRTSPYKHILYRYRCFWITCCLHTTNTTNVCKIFSL